MACIVGLLTVVLSVCVVLLLVHITEEKSKDLKLISLHLKSVKAAWVWEEHMHTMHVGSKMDLV